MLPKKKKPEFHTAPGCVYGETAQGVPCEDISTTQSWGPQTVKVVLSSLASGDVSVEGHYMLGIGGTGSAPRRWPAIYVRILCAGHDVWLERCVIEFRGGSGQSLVLLAASVDLKLRQTTG